MALKNWKKRNIKFAARLGEREIGHPEAGWEDDQSDRFWDVVDDYEKRNKLKPLSDSLQNKLLAEYEKLDKNTRKR